MDGYSEKIPISDHSTPVLMYKFGEAGMLCGLPPGMGDDRRWTVTIMSDTAEETAMQGRFPKWDKIHKLKVQPYPFARLLAKIGHGYVTAEYGNGAFTPLGCDIICGLSDDYFYTVGGSHDIAPPVAGTVHTLNITIRFTDPRRAYIRCDIRLFSSITSPSYHVVVGRIDLEREQHVRAFEQYRSDGKIEKVDPDDDRDS